MNDFREYNNYLIHYGIPGQRRGIRRYQNEDGTLTPEGKRRYLELTDPRTAAETRNRNTKVYLYGYDSNNYDRGKIAYTSYNNGQATWKTISDWGNNGKSYYRHDQTVRKAAEILEGLEHNFTVFITHKKAFGKGVDEERESRVQDFEEKILKGEQKAKKILNNIKNIFK